jgi:hypothetical protein
MVILALDNLKGVESAGILRVLPLFQLVFFIKGRLKNENKKTPSTIYWQWSYKF